MRTMSYSEARAGFATLLDSVVDDAEDVIITRSGHESAVVVSLARWQAMRETEYLLRNPANARHLREAIDRLDAGQGREHELFGEADHR